MTTSTTTTKQCKNCGSALVYAPKTGSLVCPSCGATFDAGEVSNENIKELDLVESLNDIDKYDENDDHLKVHCPNCGGDNDFPVNVVATLCQYCKTPLAGASLSTRTLRPQGMIPFSITREAAQGKFKSWISGLWFLPNAAKKLDLKESMKGVYRPSWTFDFLARCRYVGERGEYYYVTKTRKSSNGKTETYQERRTRWYPASGMVEVGFDDLLVPASTRISTQLQSELAGWTLANAIDYSEDKILGFVEESYDVRLKAGFEQAKEMSKSRIRSAVEQDIGGDEQRISSMETNYTNLSYKLLLLPFWSSSYKYNAKDYTFLVNGQTGKVHGDRPYSAVKITLFVLFLIAIFGILLYFFAQSGA